LADIFETIAELSYLGVLLLLIGVNAAPLLMPPTWIVLSSFYALDPTLDPIWLALVGATGATIGRFILKRISHLFRRIIGSQQKNNLDIIGNFLNKRKFGYVLTSFVFAATPLPSNMLFVAYGLMRAKSIGLYIGFWIGRVISYYIMVSISQVVLLSFLHIFSALEKTLMTCSKSCAGSFFFILFLTSEKISGKISKLQPPKIWFI